MSGYLQAESFQKVDLFSTIPLDVQAYQLAQNTTGDPARNMDANSPQSSETGSSRDSQIRAHQIAGYTTLALWFATNLAGEEALEHLEPEMKQSALLAYALSPSENLPLYIAMTYDNPAFLLLEKNSEATRTNQYLMYKYFRDNAEWESSAGDTHISLGIATMAAYTVTAALALTADERDAEGDFYEDGSVDSVFLHKNLAWIHLAALVAMPVLGHSLEENGPEKGRLKQNVSWLGFTTLSIAAVTVSF